VRVSRSLGLGNVLQIAVARGYLQEQGIDFHEETFASSAEAMPALASGDLDGGSTTPNASLFNALARGIRLTLALGASEFVANGNGMPLVTRLGPNGPAVPDVGSLRGKRIALTQRGVISEWALDRLLDKVGLEEDDLEVTLMPFPDQVAALGAGRLDASILVEPFATLAEQRGIATRMVTTDQYIPGAQNAIMTFSDRFANQRTDVARRFSVAYLHGARDFMDAMELGRDREEIIGILAQAANVDPAVVSQAGYLPFRRDGRVNREGLLGWLDWLVEHGHVPQKPDLAPLLDDQFADYAARTLNKQS
jgi:NitT/TauT family transport system substrate-binding protein